MSLVLMDATEEDFVETKVCVSGEFLRHNHSSVEQVWLIETAEGNREPVARIDVPITVVHPGVWTLHTPLGGRKVFFRNSA